MVCSVRVDYDPFKSYSKWNHTKMFCLFFSSMKSWHAWHTEHNHGQMYFLICYNPPPSYYTGFVLIVKQITKCGEISSGNSAFKNNNKNTTITIIQIGSFTEVWTPAARSEWSYQQVFIPQLMNTQEWLSAFGVSLLFPYSKLAYHIFFLSQLPKAIMTHGQYIHFYIGNSTVCNN